MTNNSDVNFKLIHFLLWIKGFHQSPNFETFKCSGENLPNSSCHFWKYKSVFLQILHQSSVPSKLTPIYFFSSNIIYFANLKSSPLKCRFLRFLSAPVKICQHPPVSFELKSQFLFNFCIICHCHDT